MTTINDIEFIIPCAGLSTRNYPQSKGLPHKALMPLGSYRVIDHITKDIIKCGGKHITIIVSNEEVENNFRQAFSDDIDIQNKLNDRGMKKTVEVMQAVAIPDDIEVKYVIQDNPRGTGQCAALGYNPEENRHGLMIYPDDRYFSANDSNSNLKKFITRFLNDEKKVLVQGIYQEDVSNNAILQNGRLIEKPTNPTTNIGGFSPIVIPKEILKYMHEKRDVFENQDKEWYYMDSVNLYLDEENVNNAYAIEMPVKDDEDLYMDLGTRELYEEGLLYSLLHLSIDKEKHIEKIKEFVNQL